MDDFTPQKNLKCLIHLPYYKLLHDEAISEFRDIKLNLSKAILHQDLVPGVKFWVEKLMRYICLYGYYFSKEDHVNLVKLMYELITIPKLNPTLLENFCVCLTKLLKKPSLLGPTDLQLDWKPLYAVFQIEQLRPCKAFSVCRNLQNVVKNAVGACRVFFPLSASQEMLDEWRCLIAPNSVSTYAAIFYLDVFLPTLTFPEHHHLTHKLWLSECLNTWISVSASPQSKLLMNILSRLAHDCLGYISWEPYIPLIYTLILRDFDLPVNYKNMSNHKLEVRMSISSKAKWIVNTLSEGSNGKKYMENLFKSLESYFHPSNAGKWRSSLFSFVEQLTAFFIRRIKRERFPVTNDWAPQVPAEHHLTEADIDHFVLTLRPCVMMGKSYKQMCIALNRLANLRPSLVVPDLLDRFYGAHDNLTDPSLLRDALCQLYHVSCTMTSRSRFPEGMPHVIPLMSMSLDGIDANDVSKSTKTCNFLLAMSSLVPLVNCSNAPDHFSDLTNYEIEACIASEGCEDFVLAYLDQCLHLLEACSNEGHTNIDHNKKDMNMEEAFFLENLPSLLFYILNDCGQETFKAALDKIEYFIFSRILEVKFAGRLLGRMLGSFVRASPEISLSRLLPRLNLTIVTLLTEDNINDERLDEELLFQLLLLSELITCSGYYLAPHMPLLTSLIDRALPLKSKDGYAFIASLLCNIVYNMVSCQEEAVSTDKLSIKDWGKIYSTSSAKLKWYEPSETHFKLAQELFDTYVGQQLDVVEKLISVRPGDTAAVSSPPDKDELLKAMFFIRVILVGSCEVLRFVTEDPINLIPSSVSLINKVITTSSSGQYLLLRGEEPKEVIREVMSRAVKFLVSTESDDIRTLLEIIKIYDCLLYRATTGKKLTEITEDFEDEKKILGYELCRPKEYCLSLHQIRAIHIMRLRCRMATPNVFNAWYKSICDDLVTLSTSYYSEVRIAAQKLVSKCLKHVPYLTIYISEVVSDSLSRCEQLTHEQFKGNLYLILSLHQDMPIPIMYVISNIWPRLVLASHSEKLSIRNLMDKMQEVLPNSFKLPYFNVEVPSSCTEAARRLWPQHELQVLQRTDENFSVEQYLGCLKRLELIWNTETLNWHQTEMLVRMLAKLCGGVVAVGVTLPDSIVQIILDSLIHDNVSIRQFAVFALDRILKSTRQKLKKFDLKVDYPCGPAGDMKKDIDAVNFLYDPEMDPLTEEEWNKPLFYHNKFWGYCAWPSKFLVHDLQQDTLKFEENDVIAKFFQNKSNVKSWFKFLSMENRKGFNEINYIRLILFKRLFHQYGDGFLDNILEEVTLLINDDITNAANSQRCAAEVLSGLIQGSKRWPYKKSEKLWEFLIPCFSQILEKVTPETEKFWLILTFVSFAKQDPRKVHHFLKFICHDPLDIEESSFITTCRLKIIRTLLAQLGWRCIKLYNKVLGYVSRHLDHPFENVRSEIGSLLGVLFSLDEKILKLCQVSYPDMESTLKNIVSRLQTFTQNELLEFSNPLLNLAQTVCLWIHSSTNRTTGVSPSFAPVIPIILSIEGCESYREIHNDCRKAIHAFTWTLLNTRHCHSIMDLNKDVMSCTRWRSKVYCLEFMECLIFRNLYITYSDNECRARVNELVIDRLKDDQVEVRETSAKVLCSLIHCHFIEEPQDQLKKFTKLCQSRKKSPEGNLSLHAGILGLCAFVNASPYDVPEYLPDVLMLLGDHLHDPLPISTTVKSTLSNFKRTHLDNWQEHRKKFSSDQLGLLTDLLVSPNYYA